MLDRIFSPALFRRASALDMMESVPLEVYESILPHIMAHMPTADTRTRQYPYSAHVAQRSCIRASHRRGPHQDTQRRRPPSEAPRMRSRGAIARPRPTQHCRERSSNGRPRSARKEACDVGGNHGCARELVDADGARAAETRGRTGAARARALGTSERRMGGLVCHGATMCVRCSDRQYSRWSLRT